MYCVHSVSMPVWQPQISGVSMLHTLWLRIPLKVLSQDMKWHPNAFKLDSTVLQKHEGSGKLGCLGNFDCGCRVVSFSNEIGAELEMLVATWDNKDVILTIFPSPVVRAMQLQNEGKKIPLLWGGFGDFLPFPVAGCSTCPTGTFKQYISVWFRLCP